MPRCPWTLVTAMTKQAIDEIVYAPPASSREAAIEPTWHLCRVTGPEPFQPRAHGLRVSMPHTACFRGFWCRYRVSGDRLLLTHLTCGLGMLQARAVARGTGPALFGTPLRPRITLGRTYYPTTGQLGPEKPSFTGEYYAEVSAPLEFTGRLLLAREWIPGDPRTLADRVHEFAQPAHGYRFVIELTFERGHLFGIADHSDALASYRDALAAWTARPRRPWYAQWFQSRPADKPPVPPYGDR